MEGGQTFKLRDGEIVKTISPLVLKISDPLTGNRLTLGIYDIEQLYAIAFPDRVKPKS